MTGFPVHPIIAMQNTIHTLKTGEVHILCAGGYRYAVIVRPDARRFYDGMHVRLEPNESARDGLARQAREHREKAARLISFAERIERAIS